MKKNKLIAYLLVLFVLIVPLNIGLLSIDETPGWVSLVMMVIIQFAVLFALLLGVDKK